MREVNMPTPEEMSWKMNLEQSDTAPESLESNSVETGEQDFFVTDPIAEHMEVLRMRRPDLSENDFLKIEKKLRKESVAYQKKDKNMTDLFKVWLSEKKARLASIFGIIGAVSSIGISVSHASGESETNHIQSDSFFDVKKISKKTEDISPVSKITTTPGRSSKSSTPEEVTKSDSNGPTTEKKQSEEVEALADELRELMGNDIIDRIMSLEVVNTNSKEQIKNITVQGFENCPAFFSNEPIQRVLDVVSKHLAIDLSQVTYEKTSIKPPVSYGIDADKNEVVAYTNTTAGSITFYQTVDTEDPSAITGDFLIHEVGHLLHPWWNKRATVKQRLESLKIMAYYIIKTEPTARLLPPGLDSTPTPEVPFDLSSKQVFSAYDGLIHNPIPQVELYARINEMFPELFRGLSHNQLSPEQEKIVEDALKITNPNFDMSEMNADLIEADIKNAEMIEQIKKTKIEKLAQSHD